MGKINLNILIALLAVLSSCALKKTEEVNYKSQYEHFGHTIVHSGETFGLIAKWYSLKSSNWVAIAEANPEISSNNLQIGQVIRIPRTLVTRSGSITPEFIATNSDSIEEKQAAQEIEEAANAQKLKAQSNSERTNDKNVSSSDQEAALVQSVLLSHVEQVKMLLDQGVDANIQDNDRPILAWAAQIGNQKVVEALIYSGADINAIDAIGQTALMRATLSKRISVVKTLLKNKADVNLTSPDGKTALTLAVENNSLGIAKELIQAGADLNVVDEDHNSLVLKATQNGSADMLRLLAESNS